jgi:hypothetical protein
MLRQPSYTQRSDLIKLFPFSFSQSDVIHFSGNLHSVPRSCRDTIGSPRSSRQLFVRQKESSLYVLTIGIDTFGESPHLGEKDLF